MASVRLRAANAAWKNLTKVNINKNVCLTIHRKNHFLSGRLICSMNRTLSPANSISHGNLCKILYRLDHTSINKVDSVVDEKIVAASTTGSTSDVSKSNAVESASEVKKVDSPVTNSNSKFDESMLPDIPEPPVYSSYLEEPTLTSLGLGGWSPSGIVQQILEFFHVTFDMPWWACITSLTLIVRFLLFPLTVKSRRDMIHYRNTMPEMQKLQNQLSAARKSGDYYEAARAGQEFARFMQEKAPSPIRMLFATMIQAPVFISVYFALRNMAEIPDFTSFQTGGLLWFKDLSVPDQFYALPLLTSVTVWATIKFGVSFNTVPPQVQKLPTAAINQAVQIGIPVVIFLFTMKFPAAVLCYWTASNIFVLGQTYLLSLEPVRKYYKIPLPITPPDPAKSSESKKLGFLEGFKESYTNIKIMKEIEQREYLNAVKFEETGGKPTKRTFKFDPTSVKANMSQAKK